MIPLILSAALAQDCEPLTPQSLDLLSIAARQALYDEEIEKHAQVVAELQDRIECLSFIPASERWAEILVSIAVANYSLNADWEKPLATALRIHPRVDRLVGPRHPIREWQPPPPPAPTGVSVPEGVRVYYDGELVTEVPGVGGLHLAQRRTGDGLVSVLLDDEPIPADWLKVGKLLASRDPGWVYLGLGVGVRNLAQSPDTPGGFLEESSEAGPALGVSTHGLIRLAGPVGLRLDLAAPDLRGEPSFDLMGGVAWTAGDVFLTGGAALRTVSVQVAGERRRFTVGLPVLGLGADLLDQRLLLVGEAGWSPALSRLHGRAVFSVGSGAFRPTIGLDLRASFGAFEQAGATERDIPTRDLTAALELGGRWRRAR